MLVSKEKLNKKRISILNQSVDHMDLEYKMANKNGHLNKSEITSV